MPGDLSDEQHCKDVVQETVQQLGSLHVLVNNVAQQYPQQGLEYITAEQLEKTFRINIFFLFSCCEGCTFSFKARRCHYKYSVYRCIQKEMKR
ncbi:SDR family NAD(P)-dependent oxidoreductase [Bacillus pacificus]